ncbi:hypothetical protein LCGC14_1126890 [marine sediment metagenome]|uniref:Uncharacterized protein n=1 Tax=marine sediment metagenome TaxID=412755 RepID=A0A0F9PKD7_9ZZZZ
MFGLILFLHITFVIFKHHKIVGFSTLYIPCFYLVCIYMIVKEHMRPQNTTIISNTNGYVQPVNIDERYGLYFAT